MSQTINNIHYELTIPEAHRHERLDQVLAQLLPDFSRSQIKQWIDAGFVLMDGKVLPAKTKVKGNEIIVIDAMLKEQPAWTAEPIALSIVYEDNDVLVINKPAGLVVHPGAGNANRTLLNALLYHAPLLQQLPRAGILHRLDKDTSGLLLVAKTSAALKHLSHQLKKRTLLREYQAIVYGTLISGGTVDAPIDRHPLNRKRMAVVDTGKVAITHYRVAEKYRAHTRLSVKLETGRTHQIRVHMSYVRHPLVGDTTYGGRVQLTKHMSEDCIRVLRSFKRQALHAFAIGFTHPTTQKEMRFQADIPEDMQLLIQTLRDDLHRNKA